MTLRRAKRNSVEAAGEALGDCKQLERAERLAHDRVCACFLRGRCRPAVGTGQENDRNPARLGVVLQLAAKLEAGRSGHVDVEHDHARVAAPDVTPGRLRVLRLEHIDVGDLERGRQELPKCRVVVDQQDAQDR